MTHVGPRNALDGAQIPHFWCRTGTTGYCACQRVTRADFLKIDHFAPFSEFLHNKGRNFPYVFIRSRLRMNPKNHEKFHGNRSARFSEKRNIDIQTDW